MRRRLHHLIPAVTLVVAAFSGFTGAAGAQSDSTLTVYSGRTEELIQPLLDDFAAETGVTVDVRYGDSADLALLIDEEGEQTPADLFISQSPGATGYLEGLDRLRKIDGDVLDLVSDDYQSAKGRWTGISGRVRVLVYNTDLVKPSDLPDSVLDLTKPKYADMVGVAPTNGSFQDFITAMRELEGEKRTQKWLEGMVENGARSYASNSAITDAVARGEIPMGLVNHYYAALAKAADPDVPLENLVFEDKDVGSVILVTAAAIIDQTDDRKVAEQLIEFLLSEEAQTHLAEDEFEYPLARGVEPLGDLPPLSEVDAPDLDLTSLGGGLLRTRELIAESGLEQA